jgi:protein tyrosine phosphatase (PTP) superfamily phosphohydrolase (DUF442 family)
MSKPGSEKAKRTLLYYTIIILGLLPAGFAAHYLVQTHGHKLAERGAGKQGQTQGQISARLNWAKLIELPGLPNLHKVSDDLYRGAQPTAEGMRQLKKLGVKTIVNLRLFHSDRNKITGMGFSYQRIPVTAWHPEDGAVVRFLKIATDPNCTPVFVHCQRGAHRTGLMCAVYRIAVQGWSKAEAIDEMTNGDFGFYPGWPNLIGYINKLDIEDIKRHLCSSE